MTDELNGRPVERDELKALALINYGHFTSMLVDQGRVRGLSVHLERLARDCRRLFAADLDLDRVRDYIRHALTSGSQPVVVRVTVFDPDLALGHPGSSVRPNILVTTRPAPSAPLPPLRLRSTFHCREMPEVKHVGLFGSIWHRRSAQLDGFDDVVFTDEHHHLSEAATSNIGFFDGDQVVWPKADILTGVTMTLISQVHPQQTLTAPVNLAQLADMQAAFATSSVIGIRPIVGIDTATWPDDHPIIETLRRDYESVPSEPL